MTENELYHHGILGMKWGVRRYQNEDGSLTSAGRSRYGVKDQKNALSSYRTRMKNARAARKARDNKIQDRVWKEEEALDREMDKKYPKRFQKVSDDDWAKYTKVSDKAVADWKNSKEQYKAEKAAARQELKENFRLTEGQKKALKIGAAVAGTALLAYGAYKISENNYNKLFDAYSVEFDSAKLRVDNILDRNKDLAMNRAWDMASGDRNVKNSVERHSYANKFEDAEKLGRKADKTIYSRIQRARNPYEEKYDYNVHARTGQRVGLVEGDQFRRWGHNTGGASESTIYGTLQTVRGRDPYKENRTGRDMVVTDDRYDTIYKRRRIKSGK